MDKAKNTKNEAEKYSTKIVKNIDNVSEKLSEAESDLELLLASPIEIDENLSSHNSSV